MADLESLPIALKDVGKKPSLAGQAFGVLFVLLALGAVALVTGLLLGGVIQRPMASAVPFIYVAAAGVLALGLRFIIGGAIDVLFLGVLGGGLVGGIGGVGLGFFFTEMSKHGPTGTMVGAAVGVGAGAILRLRLVGTLIFGLATAVAAYSLGDPERLADREGSLLGPVGFAPVGALTGVVLTYRTIKEQLKGGGKDFWSLP